MTLIIQATAGWILKGFFSQIQMARLQAQSNLAERQVPTKQVKIALPTFPYDDSNGEITECKLHLYCVNIQNDWADKISVYKITKNVKMGNVSWSEYDDTDSVNLTWETAE